MTSRCSEHGVSLRVSVTDRCQLRCRYCMPAEGVPACSHEDILTSEEIRAFAMAVQDHLGLSKVRITGGDPLVRRGIETLVGMLAGLDVPDIALTTNAQLLASKAAALRDAGLKRVNISLNSLKPDTFCDLSRGGDLSRTLAGIEEACRCGLEPVKLNMVVMRGINDTEAADMLSFALAHQCEVRFIELMPIGHARHAFAGRFVSSDEVKRQLLERFMLEPLADRAGSSSRLHRVRDKDGRQGVAGFISSYTEPFCSGCNRLRLTADGRLVGCLARDHHVSIVPFLRAAGGVDEQGLVDTIRESLGQKRRDRTFKRHTSMAATGG